jgi:hypothetical protein
MYPGMAKSARDEGFDEIADWFETLAKAERSHANRFQKAFGRIGRLSPGMRWSVVGGHDAQRIGRVEASLRNTTLNTPGWWSIDVHCSPAVAHH